VLLSQYSFYLPVLWTSSLSSPGYFSIPSDWCHVPNIQKNCTTKSKTQTFLHALLVWGGGAVDGGSVNAFLAAALTRVMRTAVPIPGVASASVLHSAVVGGSVVGVVRPL